MHGNTGGRGGSSYGKSQALGDVWRFAIASRTWTQLNVTGPAPLPRFLFSYDIFFPVLHQGPGRRQSSDLGLDNSLGWLGSDDSTLLTVPNPSNSDTDSANFAAREAKLTSEVAGSMSYGSDFDGPAVLNVINAEGMQSSKDRVTTSQGGNKGPAGAMIVFGGESIEGCYLNDAWLLHLNSLLWQQLSKPVACQKRCRSILEGN